MIAVQPLEAEQVRRVYAKWLARLRKLRERHADLNEAGVRLLSRCEFETRMALAELRADLEASA